MADIVKFPTRRFFITNEERASAALAAVEASAMYATTNGSMREAIGDLIGDLCHLVVRHKIPPFEMLETGAAFYVNELVCPENSLFLDVKATLNVLARRWPTTRTALILAKSLTNHMKSSTTSRSRSGARKYKRNTTYHLRLKAKNSDSDGKD